MAVEMIVKNDSWRTKLEPVEIDLRIVKEKIDLKSNDVEIKDEAGDVISHQIDQINPKNNSATLVFIADVPGGKEKKYHIQKVDKRVDLKPKTPIDWDYHFQNDKLEIWFHRGRRFGWLSGSASFVKYRDGCEIIDAFGTNIQHKKAMQLENIWIRLPWQTSEEQHYFLGDVDYEVLACKKGPIKQFLTIGRPIVLEFTNPLPSGPGKIITEYTCYLYRTLSLYNYEDFMREECYVETFGKRDYIEIDKRKVPINDKEEIIVPLSFRAQFCAFIPGLTVDGKILEHPVPDCFACGSDKFPCPGIGFASNVHILNIAEHGAWTGNWTLQNTYHVKCIHLFMEAKNCLWGSSCNFGDVIGERWFEKILKPLYISKIA